jgi:hypothetical protein
MIAGPLGKVSRGLNFCNANFQQVSIPCRFASSTHFPMKNDIAHQTGTCR